MQLNSTKKREFLNDQRIFRNFIDLFVAVKEYFQTRKCSDLEFNIAECIARKDELSIYWQKMLENARRELGQRYGATRLAKWEQLTAQWNQLDDNYDLTDDTITKVARQIVSRAKPRKKSLLIIFGGCKLNVLLYEYIKARHGTN